MIKNNKGITIIKLILIIATIDIVLVAYFVMTNFVDEYRRESVDIENIRTAITKVQKAFVKEEGTDATYYIKTGPYSEIDNEINLGTKEVIKTKNDEIDKITYAMYVPITQKRTKWLKKEGIAGYTLPEYDLTKEMYKISITTKDPQIRIELVDFNPEKVN